MIPIHNLINKYGKKSVIVFCKNFNLNIENLGEQLLEIENKDYPLAIKIQDSMKEILKTIKMFLDEPMATHDIEKEFDKAMDYYMSMIIKKRFKLENSIKLCRKEFLGE